MTKIKDYEGAVNVNGDITPITRQKIEQINTVEWPDMTVGELMDQRIVLERRIFFAQQSAHYSILEQLARGLHIIDNLIISKQSDDVGMIR